MILTGKEIEREVKAGRIVINPFDPKHCNPNSYNFHLGDTLKVYVKNDRSILGEECTPWYLETRRDNPTREIKIPEEGIVLEPGVLYLGHTIEVIGSTHYVPQMAARSSTGRLGLFIFLNSGLGDVGFMGQWTMEMYVVHPLLLRPGDRIGQMIFSAVQGEITPYRGKYQAARGPQASLIYKDQPSSIQTLKPRKLLLDAGGVLISEGSVVEALINTVVSTSKLKPTHEEVGDFWGKVVRVPLWTGRIDIPAVLDLLCNRFELDELDWQPHNLQPLPWAEQALRACPEVAVLSNHRSEWLLPAFERFGWRLPTFVSDTLGTLKPEPDCYLKCLSAWGSAPEEVLFVDNKQINVDAARQLGMQALLADPQGQWVSQVESIFGEGSR